MPRFLLFGYLLLSDSVENQTEKISELLRRQDNGSWKSVRLRSLKTTNFTTLLNRLIQKYQFEAASEGVLVSRLLGFDLFYYADSGSDRPPTNLMHFDFDPETITQQSQIQALISFLKTIAVEFDTEIEIYDEVDHENPLIVLDGQEVRIIPLAWTPKS